MLFAGLIALSVLLLLVLLLAVAYRSGAELYEVPLVELVGVDEARLLDLDAPKRLAERHDLQIGGVANLHWGPEYVHQYVWLSGDTVWAEVSGGRVSWVSRGGDGVRYRTAPGSHWLRVATRVVDWAIRPSARIDELIVDADFAGTKRLHLSRVPHPNPIDHVDDWRADLGRQAMDRADHLRSSRLWQTAKPGVLQPTWRGAFMFAVLVPFQLVVTHSNNLENTSCDGGRETRPVTF